MQEPIDTKMPLMEEKLYLIAFTAGYESCTNIYDFTKEILFKHKKWFQILGNPGKIAPILLTLFIFGKQANTLT